MPRQQPLKARNPFLNGVLDFDSGVAFFIRIAGMERFRRTVVQKDKIVPRHEAIGQRLNVLLNPETGVSFANRAILSRRAIELCNRAGVKGSAHCFRDTFACDMLTRGVGVFEVAKMLADTVETVEQCYAEFIPALRDNVQAKMDSGVGIEEQAKIAAQRGKKVVGIRG